MRCRPLGETGLEVSVTAAGEMTFGDFALATEEVAAIRRAFEGLDLEPLPVPWNPRTKLRYLWRKVFAT